MVKFTEIIDVSIEWTAAMLFRPFKPKKWLILTFVALLAGYMAGGGNFNAGNNFDRSKESVQTSKISASIIPVTESRTTQSLTGESSRPGKFLEGLGAPEVILIIFILLLVVAVIPLFMWLSSRFNFIFIQNIIRNDASIRKPFRENRLVGNSYFLFSLIYSFLSVLLLGVIGGACFLILFAIGTFNQPSSAGFVPILLTCLAFGALFMLALALVILVGFAVHEFVLFVMFRDRIGIKEAWPKFVSIFKKNKLDFVVYFFVKLGLSIACWLIYAMISLAAYISLFWPALVIGGCIYAIYNFLSATALQIVFLVGAAIVFLPVGLFFLYCLYCLNLPFAVFLRTLSLKFIARIDPGLNLFNNIQEG